MSKKRVLYLTARSPFPVTKGDQVIAYNQLKRIHGDIDLHLITFVKSEKEKQQLISELGASCKITTVKFSRVQGLVGMIMSLLIMKPLQVGLFNQKAMRRAVAKIILEFNPDVVHVQTIRMAAYLNFFKKADNKVIDFIDALSLNMNIKSKTVPLLLSFVYRIESFLCEKYEQHCLAIFSKYSVVAPLDRSAISKNISLDQFVVNPNGVELAIKPVGLKNRNDRYKVVFHGNMQYFPNVQAVRVLVDEIFPIIKQNKPNAQLFIIGKDPDVNIQKYHDGDSVIVTGFVENISDFLIGADLGVYPITIGTGMPNKILEALASNVPVVTTEYVKNCFSKIDFQSSKDVDGIDFGESFYYVNDFSLLLQYTWEKNMTKLYELWEVSHG